MDGNMDERQILVRGRIFKHTAFILIGLLFIEGMLNGFFGIRFFEGMWSNVFIVSVAIVVMTAEMVWHGAHPLVRRGQIFLFAVCGVVWLALAVIGIVELTALGESFTAENALSESAAALFTGLLYMADTVVFAVRCYKDRKDRKAKKKDEEPFLS